MLMAPIYNYIKLISYSLSLISFAFAVFVYIRFGIREAFGMLNGRRSKGEDFNLIQCDFEVHTKESIWKK